jgi:transposase
LDWITALKHGAIRKLAKKKVIQPGLFDAKNVVEVSHPDYPGERLVACFNPFTKDRNEATRRTLLERTEKGFVAIAEKIHRKREPLRGQAEIGMEAGKLLSRTKMGKYFKLTFTDQSLAWQRRQEVIDDEMRLDGIYVIRTKVPSERLDATQTRDAYHSLSKVERAFRCLKDFDIQVRPIFHYLDHRVRSHLFLCMLAYYIEWHMRKAWESLLCMENPPKPHAGKRATGRTAEGLPVMTFRGIMRELAGLPRLIQRIQGNPDSEITTYPPPSELQGRALDLLGLTPAV